MFDLDAVKAARREALGDAPEFTFGGETFKLPVEMPFAASLAFNEGRVVEGMAQLLGKEGYEQFIDGEPSEGDVVALAEWIGTEYEGRGQSPDSGNSGKGTTKGSGRGKAQRSKS